MSDGTVPTLEDLPPPVAQPAVSLTGRAVSPSQRVYFYSPSEWEEFIREWATALQPTYEQLKLLGGTGDQGIDIAAFKTIHGFEGAWDCFQAKHYKEPLTPSDVLPEVVKLFRHAVAGDYPLPDCYFFVAPRGCGAKLNRLLSKPAGFKQVVLDSDVLKKEPTESQIRVLVEATDFAMFRSMELVDALEAHRQTPYHVGRFGGPLAPRPLALPPPAEVADIEARYVAQLIAVYAESGAAELELSGLSGHPSVGRHFTRQRLAFYQAESLRLYARDSVPEGTFELLQDDVLSGVVEIAERQFPNGMDRLSEVLTTSATLDLGAHTLIAVTTNDDRKGICHQLANEDRLVWVRSE